MIFIFFLGTATTPKSGGSQRKRGDDLGQTLDGVYWSVGLQKRESHPSPVSPFNDHCVQSKKAKKSKKRSKKLKNESNVESTKNTAKKPKVEVGDGNAHGLSPDLQLINGLPFQEMTGNMEGAVKFQPTIINNYYLTFQRVIFQKNKKKSRNLRNVQGARGGTLGFFSTWADTPVGVTPASISTDCFFLHVVLF